MLLARPMITLPTELLRRYLASPLALDTEVRARLNLPRNRYYTVSAWPVAGVVRVSNLTRTVATHKVSKSDL